MMAWWRTRTLREQRLLMAAGLLLAVIIVSQLIAGPVLRARAQARIALAEASQTAALVSQLSAVRPAGEMPAPQAPILDADAARTETATLAAGRGLAISRIQAGADGRFGILIDDADPAAIFAWLQENESRTGLHAATVAMSETRDGRVRVSVDFERPAAR